MGIWWRSFLRWPGVDVVKTGIVTDPIQPSEVLSGLPSEADGACLLFLGVVRDHNQGRPVAGLDYQVYQGMAE